MEEIFNSENQLINLILIAIGLLLLMALATVLFFYFSRKRIIKTQLEKAHMEIEHQKNMLQATIITQEEERKRIAQDMHDAISSKLNVVSLNANFLTEGDITTEDAHKFGESIQKVTATVLENSRRIAHDLLPPTLEKFGLKAAIEELCEEVSEAGAFQVEYALNYTPSSLSDNDELHLFRIAQELFNNAIKYSEASKLSLHLESSEAQCVLGYEDNGKGCDVSKAFEKKGLGISGMQNRAAILQAQFEMTSTPGDGMKVNVTKNL